MSKTPKNLLNLAKIGANKSIFKSLVYIFYIKIYQIMIYIKYIKNISFLYQVFGLYLTGYSNLGVASSLVWNGCKHVRKIFVWGGGANFPNSRYKVVLFYFVMQKVRISKDTD